MNTPPPDNNNGTEAQATAVRRRTGGRSARVRQAVLAATLDQITEHGIEGLTVGDVAARAGVAETTVYRRWGSRTTLIAEALAALAEEANPVPDTGDLREDLHLLAAQIARLISRPGIARLIGTSIALSSDEEVAAARHRFWNDRFGRSAQIVVNGIERGELPETVDPRSIIEMIAAPIYFRIFVTEEVPTTAFIEQCIDNTLWLHGVPARKGRAEANDLGSVGSDQLTDPDGRHSPAHGRRRRRDE